MPSACEIVLSIGPELLPGIAAIVGKSCEHVVGEIAELSVWNLETGRSIAAFSLSRTRVLEDELDVRITNSRSAGAHE